MYYAEAEAREALFLVALVLWKDNVHLKRRVVQAKCGVKTEKRGAERRNKKKRSLSEVFNSAVSDLFPHFSVM